MKIKQHFNKFLTIILAIVLLFPTTGKWPMTAIKADESTELCKEHTEHTEDCGYKEPTDEIPCTHEHDDNCGYDPEIGTGCSHIHDENCGYVAANEGSPCTFVCNDDTQTGDDTYEMDNQSVSTTTYSSESFEIPFEGKVYLRNPLYENMPLTEQFSFSLYRKIISKNDSFDNQVYSNDLLNGDIKNDSNGMLDLDTLSFSLIDLTEAGIDSGSFECIYMIKQNIPDDLTQSIYWYDPIEWTITIPGKVINNGDSKVLDISENQIDVSPENYTYPDTITIDFLNQTSAFQLTAEKAIQLNINEPTSEINNEDYRKPNADEVFDFQISVYQDSLSIDNLNDSKFEPELEKFSVINKVNNQNEKIDFGEITTYYNDSRFSELINGKGNDNFLLYKIEEIDSGDYNALLQGYYILINVKRDNYGILLNLFPYEFNAGSSFNEVITSQSSNSLVFRNYKALTHIQTEKHVNYDTPLDTFTFNLYKKKIIPAPDGEPTSLNMLVSTIDESDNKDRYNDIGDFVSSTTNIGRFIKFQEIYYTEDDLKDADGNEVDSVFYLYTIKEEDKDGYTNDGRVLQYIVEVGRLNGIIAVKKNIKSIMLPNGDTTIIEDWSNKWAFYNSTASFHLKGEKLMWDENSDVYRVPEPNENFTFHVYPYNQIIDAEVVYGEYYPKEDFNIDTSNFTKEPILTTQNQGSHIDFGSIDFANDYRLENLEREKPVLLFYLITEESTDGYHVRNNNYLELYVEKSSNGSINLLYSHIQQGKTDDSNLKYKDLINNYSNQILFENSYPHVSFKGEKYVNNVPATENEVFTFNLYRKTMYYDEDIRGDYGSLIATTQNKGKSIKFPEIRYSDIDFENNETVKRYIYTITEESKDGYLTDKTIYRYVVKLSKEADGVHALIEDSWLIDSDGNVDNHIAIEPFVFNNSHINGGARIPAITMVNKESAQDYDHFQFNLEYLFRVYSEKNEFPLNQVERIEKYTIENTVGKKDENGDILPNIQFTTKPFDEVTVGEKYTYVYSMQEVQTENSKYTQDESLWLVFVQVINDAKYGNIALTKTYYNIPADALLSIRNAVAKGTISTEKDLTDSLKQLDYAFKLSDNEYPYFENYRSFIEINATKTVNDYEPSEDEIFDFQATPVVIINSSPLRSNTNAQHSNSMRSTVNVAQNHLGNINFYLDYSWASTNDTVLTLLEETSQSDDIYTVDDTKYLIEVELKFNPDNLSAPTLKTVYKVNNWELVEAGLNTLNGNSNGGNYEEVIKFLLNKGYLTIISPDEIVFNNLKKTTSVTVEKVWKLDDGKTAADSVTVVLYKDGVKYDSKILNNDNNWQYTWDNLPMANWTVEEVNPPKGFKVSIEQIDNKFIITNDDIGDSVDPIDPNPDKPVNPDKPDKPVDPDKPDKPVDPENPVVPDIPNNDSNQPSDPNYNIIDENGIPTGAEHPSDDLPLTGQLWWPVWLLALLGSTMVAVGIFMKRRQHEQNEK